MSISKVVVFLALVGLSTACLITNCPKGGKRSFPLARKSQEEQCIRCGPGLAGRCVGPALCCGPTIGCLLAGPSVLAQCHTAIPPPPAQTCVLNSLPGTCVAKVICCSQDSCRIDTSCDQGNSLDVCSPSRMY